MEEKMVYRFSRKVLDVMVRFASALGHSKDKNGFVHVRAIKDGPIEMRMLDTTHIEMIRVIVQRSEEDNSEFVTTFSLSDLEMFVKATDSGTTVEVTMTHPIGSEWGPYYQKIRMLNSGVWTTMDADNIYARAQEIRIPQYSTDFDIDVMNADIMSAYHLFSDGDLVCLTVKKGEQFQFVAEEHNGEWVQTKGVTFHSTTHDADLLTYQYDWKHIKRTMKVFTKLGKSSGKTNWTGGRDAPLRISWSMDEMRIEFYLAPRTRDS
jgi:hypothetical protein